MRNSFRRLPLLLLLWLPLALCAQGLRTSVCIVYPECPPEDSTIITSFSTQLARVGFTTDAKNLRAYASRSFGSGVLTKAGVLTNRHVVGYAAKATLVFQLHDQTLTFEHCAVASVSEESDIALVLLPEPSELLHALPLSEVVPDNAEEIYAAGFPGLANEASWQLTRGAVSNSSLLLDGDHYIQHTAAIDPGSSGGPLLRKRDGKFEIVGLNTLKFFGRDRVGMAIPSAALAAFLSAPRSNTYADVLGRYSSVDPEHWKEYYMLLPDSMKTVLHDMEVLLPMDRVEAVANYYGGPDQLQKQVDGKLLRKADADTRLSANRPGLTELEHDWLIAVSYDQPFRFADGYVVSVSADWGSRYFVAGFGVSTMVSHRETNVWGKDANGDPQELKDTVLLVGPMMDVHMGLQLPARVAPHQLLVPRIQAGTEIGITLPSNRLNVLLHYTMRGGLDYHYELNRCSLVAGLGYTCRMHFSQGFGASHMLHLKLGVAF